MEYYSAIKQNEIMPFAEMWMDLETVIQSGLLFLPLSWPFSPIFSPGSAVSSACIVSFLQWLAWSSP